MSTLFLKESLSPLDGRYSSQLSGIRSIFSEPGLIRQRIRVEVSWLIHLYEGKQKKGWNFPFVIYAIPILFIPLFLVAFKDIKQGPNSKTVKVKDNENQVKLWPVYLTGFFSMLLFYMLPTQLPYLIINTLHAQPSDVGHIIAFSMLINALTARQYSRLKNRYSFQRIFIIIYILFAMGLLIISKVTHPSQLYISALFLGAGFGLVLVNINVWLLSLVNANRRGHAIGILTSSFFFGQFFSPILFEPIISEIGIQGVFLMVSLLCFTIAGAFIFLQCLKKLRM